MVIEWRTGEDGQSGEKPLKRAAEYVRMSTEHQKYSTDNQSAEIRAYAARRGFEIVRTYADEGKSGLRIDGRDSFQQLLSDIQSGNADFEAILVYDVSRWGRFQDPNEASHYVWLCKSAGISIHYCAEQVENDGSMGSSIVTTVKQVMAGEYSRELSIKVFKGQCRLITLGYRQGGPPGFGLRRMLVDEHGNQKGLLDRGEHKSIATDRVVLVEGPDEEVALVREIYRQFVEDQRSERQIADWLNAQGIMSDLERPWSRGAVHQILINEKYVGHNVWGRTSFKLKTKHVRNDPSEWIRHDSAFPAIVPQPLFDAARLVIDQRSQRLSDEEMLALLADILAKNGSLSGLIIDEYEDGPSSSAYQSRFGSLLRAYSLVGYVPDHDYRYLEINRALRRMHPSIVKDVIEGVRAAGGTAIQNLENDTLLINEEITASIVIARCKLTRGGSRRWKIRLDESLRPDITICVRMDEENMHAHDYYILPRMTLAEGVLRLADHNGLSLDAFRFESLDGFFTLAERAPFRKAA
ncbi:recombinase family protein [Sphingomonas canadensis]|jgi:DNA invertase Pin-like site-specific DNA recombinase|uniref:Recombinase family protein n=1 Tax=Sphingomonas canadensis TaxID=1219257 RepID=A0ABW3H8T2_9SPHN|nr:recombinase family protein [Sphingomonas canadensis]MCW3837441.1 recombinase family protein [Sphingomonas canadensis]